MEAATALFSSGIYSITQAARLLGIAPSRLRGWVTSPGAAAGPLIASDLPAVAHRHAISFLNLIEARLIAAFSNVGIHANSIRAMADEARRFLDGNPHPFATSLMFQTDGQGIFIRVAETAGDPRLYDLRRKNWGLYRVLERELKGEVQYGPTGIAAAWYPHKQEYSRVFVHPKVTFGQPAIDKSGVPTAALYDAYVAEGRNLAAVARWFEVPVAHVKEAVRFESALRPN